MIRFWNAFTKITAWPVQLVCFRTHVFYLDKNTQSRKINGSAIVICNHTSVFDFAVLLFVFFWRTVRYLMAETLFEKKLLGWFLKKLGGIRVDRLSHDYGYMDVAENVLAKGGVIGIFPESRLPKEGEERPLPFKPGAAFLALETGVPVIPVWTNGSYFCKKHASVLIGTPFYARDLAAGANDEKEKIELVCRKMREKVMALGKELEKYESA